ncbi:MAG: spermidine/putrescine ABC transporter substrate-binding protein [Desulfovibrionaceae bacterium]|nr:spermidine/putrescine ABC transporter substrate-binding protein [Desulfovibrionaceae bacterium]
MTPHRAEAAATKEVVIFNWSDYIPEEVLNDFTKETGINVVYSTYESNESMFSKLQVIGAGKAGYDIVVPSTYYINMLKEQNLIQKLDLSKVGNIKHLDPKFLDQDYDKGNAYSIPYMWGGVGILVNTEKVKTEISSWADLANPDFAGKLLLSDDLRDLFGMALKAHGLSPNTAAAADLKVAYEWLRKIKPLVRVFSSQIKPPVMGDEVLVGMGWNGDVLLIQEEKPEISFIWPKEGTLVWVDSFVLLKGAPNLENAYKFIDYMLRPEVAVKCVEEYMYSTPNLSALKLLPEELVSNPVFRPTEEDLVGSDFLLDIGQGVRLYSDYWEQLLHGE